MQFERIRTLGRTMAVSLLPIAVAASVGCQRPCRELADTLCSEPGTDAPTCEAWRERTGRVPAETCELALRAWKRDRTR